jgi:hypothetical protein
MTELIFCERDNELFRRYFLDCGNGQTSSFAHFFRGIVALEAGICCGHIALFLHSGQGYHEEPVLTLGYFHCINDQPTADLLLDAATELASACGMDCIAAPVNGTTWHDYRLPLTGGGPLFSGDLAAPLYYADLLTANGFEVAERYYSYKASLIQAGGYPLDLNQDNVVLRTLDLTRFEGELNLLYPVCNAAFAANPLFTGLSRQAFLERHLPLKQILHPGLTLLAEGHDRLPLAFMLCYHDHTDPSGQTLVLKTVAKNPDRNEPGLMSRVGAVLYRRALMAGYTSIIHAMMHEHNASLRRSLDFGGTLLRSYGLFIKNVKR